MNAVIASLAAAPIYGLSALLAWHRPRWATALVPLALALHFAALALGLVHQGSLRIGVTEAASLFAWQSAVLLWLFALREPIAVNGTAIYPLAAVFAVWAALVPSPISQVRVSDWQVTVHVLLSLLSAGLLTLAAVQSVALAIQDRLLHRHRVPPTGARLPPLQTMERVLFQLIAVGFALLSLTLLTGLWFVHDWMAQHLAHKTVLSVSAWMIFGVLLWGRWRYGWRGRTAIRWALAGYATLVVAYFGSKAILEQIFGNHWS
ncbi:cytochrome C assembly family protein [Panacagrimonas sp.]|uniref:cytochrome C assembly family protein n=1 Tax=Panacagrimonas sp. TaxID=2480088 RepID=UPI003B5300B5